MAKSYEDSRRTEQAAGVYRQIVETYVDRGLHGKALETCRKALEALFPHETSLRERLAEMLTRKGSLEEAKKEYENILRYQSWRYSNFRYDRSTFQTNIRRGREESPPLPEFMLQPPVLPGHPASWPRSILILLWNPVHPEAISARGQEGLTSFCS